MRYIAIDYGQKGALASLSESGEILQLTKMPVKSDGSIDAYQVMMWLTEEYHASAGEMVVYAEKLHAIFGSSAGSNFSFGKNIGMVLSQIECLRLPYVEVRAMDWQEYMFDLMLYAYYSEVKPGWTEVITTPEMGDIKKSGKYKRDTKAMASFAFDAIFPYYERNTTDGERDAVLIAEYARRTHIKESN